MRILLGVILALIVLAGGGVAFIYSGMYNVAASDEHSALGRWAMHTTMENSIQARADEVNVPDLADDEMVRQGAQAYDSLCAACHLKPGMQDTVLRQGLNPMPPALTERAHGGPAEQFWIVKHGIRMTGMPAWGETHEDQELWEIVAFLQRLPELSESQYQALVQPSASPSGEQTDDGHDHEHGDTSGMMGTDATASEATHDAAADHHDSGESPDTAPRAEGQQESGDDHYVDDHYADGHSH